MHEAFVRAPERANRIDGVLTLDARPITDAYSDDWKNTPDVVLESPIDETDIVKGLCATCAMAFASSLSPLKGSTTERFGRGAVLIREHWMSGDEYKLAWVDREYRGRLFDEAMRKQKGTRGEQEDAASFAEALLAWPRCGVCPIWVAENVFLPPVTPDLAPTAPRCADCERRAHLEAWLQFSDFPALVTPSVLNTETITAAFWMGSHAFNLIENARKSLLRAQSRCDACPSAAPPKAPREAGLEKKILAVLAGHGVPMSVNDLLDARIKGLTKNNVAKIMRALAESGEVLMTNRGPSKFFELP